MTIITARRRTRTPKEGDTIAVWFSCGAASAVATKLTLSAYGNFCNVRIINNPVAEEHEDNERFLRDCEQWFGRTIERAVNPDFPHCSAEQVWNATNYLSGIQGASCTLRLKRLARQHWENNNHHDWLVMGFTAEETKRYKNFVLSERSNTLPILIDANLTKQDCFDMVLAAGLRLPAIYELGYPNANCIGCIKANSPTYWNHVRKTHPDIFQRRAEISRRLGVKLVQLYEGGKKIRMFLDELPADRVAAPMKSLKMPECGIFCEEKIIK